MTTFAEFAETLSEEDRDTLFASVPMIIAMVVGADGEFDELEVGQAVDEMFAAGEQLSTEFHWSSSAQAAFERISPMARDPKEAGFHGRLLQLRDVLRQMPQELRDRYHEFVLGMAIRLAAASGGFLWFGRPISEEEKIALRKIIIALGIEVKHEGLREFLESDD
jgi:tellurite resistance protein